MLMLYFSATGNSKYVAELFCKRMNATCRSIEENVDFDAIIASEEVVGFCYPIYASRVPRLMREFAAKHAKALKHKKLIIFCTQMCFSGDGARAFTDIFPRGFAEVIYAEHFPMPNNVCNLFVAPLASARGLQRYRKNTHRKMQAVCEDITNGIIKKRGFNPVSRALGLMQGASFPSMEEKAKNKVWIDGECNQCGLCVSICPVKNLACENGKVMPKNNCMMCYRCINKCPKKAISVLFRGKVKKQYRGITTNASRLEP